MIGRSEVMGTAIVSLILAGVVGLIIRHMVKDKKAGKSLNGKNAVQNARTSKAIYAAALASPVLATPLTPGLSA